MEKFLGDSAIFLLGGRDLEMEEIKKTLIAEGFVPGRDLFDHDLDWESAELEAYSDILEKFPDKTIYAVELNIDEKNDSLYKQHKSHIHIIDHHKADADTPASLLQVLEILDRKPTRDQKLIAANDSGYIAEMLCLNASDEEIADIRQRDREAQGIKPLEYQTALQEIANLEDGDGIYKLHTSLEHFSPLADALYFGEKIIVGSKAMIIRNEREICFYGFDGYDLKTIAASFDLDEDDYYYGGRQGGYFCIKKDLLSSKEMDAMVDKAIKKRLDSRTLYSSHILMFPFRFDYVTNDEYVREYDFMNNIVSMSVLISKS